MRASTRLVARMSELVVFCTWASVDKVGTTLGSHRPSYRVGREAGALLQTGCKRGSMHRQRGSSRRVNAGWAERARRRAERRGGAAGQGYGARKTTDNGGGDG